MVLVERPKTRKNSVRAIKFASGKPALQTVKRVEKAVIKVKHEKSVY
jgi:hypothetical protein